MTEPAPGCGSDPGMIRTRAEKKIVTDLNRDYLLNEQGAAIKREIPVGRFGEERDLDGALLLLVSDAGRFIAGTTIVVDGGQMVALRG